MRMIIFVVAAMLPTIAAADESVTVGEQEYNSRCAACHGMDGKGNGPMAELLSVGLPDLTKLTVKNDGEFPYEHVYRIVDGRAIVGAHGTREMPIWGNEYNEKAVGRYDDLLGSLSSEIYVSGRIFSLMKHLQTIQAE